ncbi:MAG TPA: amidase [Streptosporangiaceae bacterium]|jgi:aspartyl-tRNA(Asn)/glutamyl-tRNA(Gln) amidotransferase subunit A
MTAPYELTLAAAADAVAKRELSPVELVDSVLARIDDVDPKLTAFVTVTADSARAAAKDAERALAGGAEAGPLHGVPVSLKDIYDVAGVRTTASSRLRADAPPAERDSAVAERLRAAGAIFVGKTHTHEFAYGMYTPTTHNPWDLDRSPGGSSGGAGAAVAARMSMAGMGTDTGGSVRIPAALCGLTGLKPTYGRVSRRGVIPLSWSLDHAGPLTRTVRDAALMMNAISGYDPGDAASVDAPVPDHTADLERGAAGLTLGVPAHFFEDADPEIAAVVRQAVDALAAAGARLREVTLPLVEYAVAAEGAILSAEAFAYHRRNLRDRPELFTEQVRARVAQGEKVGGADYVTAQRLRTALRDAWRDTFRAEGLDALVAPTLGGPAGIFGRNEVHYTDGRSKTTSAAYAPQVYPANMTGLPALSVPCGFTGDGMPIGLQIIGRPLAEPTVLRIGRAYESATDWAGRAPAL